jgi:hypothetical protein
VLAQLEQNLVHLERRGQRLDQNRRLDRAAGDPQCLLSEAEHVIPQAGLEVGFELRQIEVGTGACAQ